MSNDVTLDTLQDKQMLDDFVEAKKGGICGIMGDRYINQGNGNDDGKGNGNDNDNGKTIAEHGQRSIREPASQIHDVVSPMAEHDRRSIWYIDANNLYGYVMMQKQPYKDFEYTDTSLDTTLSTPDDSDGYYIVCDINYTNSCKYRTEQLALMPNKRKINDDELGYIKRGMGKARSEKLILDQNNKTEYMVHYRTSNFYGKMGVKIIKIHSVSKFKQDYICRDYIENNTNNRATTKTEAEKDVRKLLNNSLYGRMCMNPLHFLQRKFLHDEEK